MTNQLSTTEVVATIVEETRELLNFGRKVALKVAFNIYQLRESFSGEHEDFVKWCWSEFELGGSQVSKYETIGDAFYAKGYTPESFLSDGAYRDYEVVYAAAKLPDEVEERFSKALTWSRQDFKDEASEQAHDPKWNIYCSTCGKSKEKHPSYGNTDSDPF